jgi:hypothetical protein
MQKDCAAYRCRVGKKEWTGPSKNYPLGKKHTGTERPDLISETSHSHTQLAKALVFVSRTQPLGKRPLQFVDSLTCNR